MTERSVRLLINSASNPGTFTMGAAVDCGGGPVALAAANLDGDGDDDLVAANAFGAADEPLTDRSLDHVATMEDISESPDGLKLAVNANRDVELDGASVAKLVQELVIIDLASNPPVATPVPGTDTLGERHRIRWDPTSTRLYYEITAVGPTDPPSLYVIRVIE